MKLLLIKAVSAVMHDTFFRLGRAWTKEGTVVPADEFTEAEWAVLAAEPMLHIGPAPSDAEVTETGEREVIDAIKAALGDLTPDDFDANGKPKVAALKARLPDQPITAALRDAAWAEVTPAPAP